MWIFWGKKVGLMVFFINFCLNLICLNFLEGFEIFEFIFFRFVYVLKYCRFLDDFGYLDDFLLFCCLLLFI